MKWWPLLLFATGCTSYTTLLCEPCADRCAFGLVCEAGMCVPPGEPSHCGIECVETAQCNFGRECSKGQCIAPIDISAGFAHGCALWESGRVSCWGFNSERQVTGLDGALRVLTPIEIPHVEGAVELVSGDAHNCVRNAEGLVSCWGVAPFERTASGDLRDAKAIAAGATHTCALIKDGQIRCFGQNQDGQLGFESERDLLGVQFTAIGPGGHHTCAVGDGRVYCWGRASDGQLRDALPTNAPSIFDAGLEGVVELASGWTHTCALLQDGSIECWGWYLDGPVGRVDLPGRAVSVDAHGSSTCATLENGQVECWGDWSWVVLPNAELSPRSFRSTNTAAGATFACGIAAEGSVECWGWSGFGQLGLSHNPISVAPHELKIKGAINVEAGVRHTCAQTEGGEVYCWGSNLHGQVGGQPSRGQSTMHRAEVEGATDLGTGARHTCVRNEAAEVLCWGRNEFGECGGAGAAFAPRVVAGLPPVHAIDAGFFNTCALTEAQTVWCWGRQFQAVPQQIAGLSNIEALTVGDQFGCTLSGGAVTCFGSNQFGQLNGRPGVPPSGTLPVDLPGPARAVVSGARHSCATLMSGAVHCWGFNQFGELGGGTTTPHNASIPVVDVANPAVIGSGGHSTCVTQPEVWCWGANAHGQIGDGTFEHRTRPVELLSLPGASDLTSGEFHACAVIETGRIACWGIDNFGQVTATPAVTVEPRPVFTGPRP